MTAPMTITNCPTDPNLMAAFIDGRLDGDERRTVIEHMSTCAECRDVFMTASELAEESGGGEVVPMRRPWLAPAVALAAAAAIGAVVFLTPVNDMLFGPKRLRELSEATAQLEERPIAARTSIVDMAYKDFPRMRGGKVDFDIAVAPAALPLIEAAARRPTVRNLHAAGVAFLLMKRREEAVQYLEQALKEQTSETDVGKAIAASTDADLLGDFAAASHGPLARMAIDRAWQLKKSAPVAWTRAEIHRTAQAWQDYLAIDNTSEWATEARGMLDLYTGN